MGMRRPRRQHGQDRHPGGRRHTRRGAPLRRRPARLPHLHRRSGPGHRPSGHRPASRARSMSPIRGRPPGSASSARSCPSWATTRPGCIPSPRATSTLPPTPHPGRPTPGWTTPALRLSGLPPMPRWEDALARLVAALPDRAEVGGRRVRSGGSAVGSLSGPGRGWVRVAGVGQGPRRDRSGAMAAKVAAQGFRKWCRMLQDCMEGPKLRRGDSGETLRRHPDPVDDGDDADVRARQAPEDQMMGRDQQCL